MPARKRVYTALSDDRYLEKSVKMHAMQGIPLEMAIEHARRRLSAWKGGFIPYHQKRMALKDVLEARGIAPSARAPFYACLNELNKNGVYLAKAGDIRAYVEAKYPTVAEEPEILDFILELCGIEVRPPEERETKAHKKSG